MNRGRDLPVGRVAMLFTDVQGSTALLHELGESFGQTLDEHDRVLRGVWEEFDGVEVDNEGDAFFVVFPDHEQAIRAVAAAQERLASARWPADRPVKVRMALHSGEPSIRGQKYWGVDVHYAARLGSAAHGGQVLLSADMHAQVPDVEVESLGAHGLKDFPVPREMFHLRLDGGSARDFPPPRTLTAGQSNLPTIDTPIIGRDAILAALHDGLVGADRLVTVVGPGGIGKTRASVALGEAMKEEFPHGVAFVAMAPLREAEDVLAAIAEAIREDIAQLPDRAAALTALLRDRRLLVVLDNAEHLPELGRVLAPVVAAAPGVKWLVTSQAPLGLRAERVVRLDALELPTGTEPDLEAVPAAAMFLERVRAHHPDFEVSGEDRDHLVTLCRILEGIPLALELAAARAPALGLAHLVQALGRDGEQTLGRGPVDLPDRQQGLQAALDWTVSLLAADERGLYATCGAFAEAWSIEDLEQMLSDVEGTHQVWEGLARLLDLSLVVQRGDGRFTMPERVRRHAVRVLTDSPDHHATRHRHLTLVLDKLVVLLQFDRLQRFRAAMADIEELLDEVVHALAWSEVEDRDSYRMLLGRAGWALQYFGRLGARGAEAVQLAAGEDPGDLAQGWLLMLGSTQTLDESEAARRSWLERAVERFHEFGDHAGVIEATNTLFELEMNSGNLEQARGIAAFLISHARTHGFEGYAQNAEDELAILALNEGDIDTAERQFRRWLDEPGIENWARGGTLSYLGDCAFARGAYAEAAQLYAHYLEEIPHSASLGVVLQIYGVGAACAALGRFADALELRAVAQKSWVERTGQPWTALLSGTPTPEYDQPYADAEAALSPEEAEAARLRGRALDYEAGIRRTLEKAASLAVLR